MSSIEQYFAKYDLKVDPKALTAVVPFITFVMFGGFLGHPGVIGLVWGRLPGIANTPFPTMMGRVGAGFTLISIFAPPLRLLTAGLADKYMVSSKRVGELGVEDLPVVVAFFAAFVLYMALTAIVPTTEAIPFTTRVLASGFVMVLVLLSYNSVPYYVEEYAPGRVEDPIDGLYVLSLMLATATMLTIAATYIISMMWVIL